MSSELERLLREARNALPEPDDDATARERVRVLASLRRRPTRTRALVLAGTTLAATVAFGVTAGSLNAPSGSAAREPAVIGFVPEPGWSALQSPPPAVPGQQTVAVAGNVPFAADDVVHGLVEPSGLPYSTLLSLPPTGIVIVSTMVTDTAPHVAPVPTTPVYPKAELPLRLRDGVPLGQWGARVRMDQPLAQYQLRAKIGPYYVDVVAYFGTSRPSDALLDEAQRQLDRLVVRAEKPATIAPTSQAAPRAVSASIIDRTYSCRTVILGGLYQLISHAHAGTRSGSAWSKLAYVGAASGGWAGPSSALPSASSAPPNSLAWITAGVPTRSTTAGDSYEVFSVLGGGTLGVNTSLCRPSTARVALSGAGLPGGAVGRDMLTFKCDAPRSLLVRFRATVDGTSALRERARVFVATDAPVSEAKLAVRTPAGRPLMFGEVSQSGKTRLSMAKGCAAN